jgi:hypothetical protein
VSKLLYSIAAIRRLLKLPQTAKIHVQNWFKVLWVWVEGQRPTLISKFALKCHFVEHRQVAARSLFVEQFHSNIYFVSHPNEDKSRRRVQLFTGGLTCQCEDFQAQAQVIGRACCKHAYAVLNHLGFDSLSAYIGT